MSPDPLALLRGHDPARTLDAAPPGELRERILAEPRGPAGPPRRPSRRAVLTAALAVGAGVVGFATLSGGAAPIDLAARAYAQTTQGPGEILHVVVRGRTTFEQEDGSPATSAPPDGTGTVERWSFGEEAHIVLRDTQEDGRTASYDQLLDREGRLTNRFEDGREQSFSAADGPGEKESVEDARRDWVGAFRKRYERGVLDESGDVEFAGRPARRYVVDAADPAGDGGEYFVDAESGAPLGSITTNRLVQMEKGFDGKLRAPGLVGPSSGPATGTSFIVMRNTQVVERLERLPATPENLRLVRERGR